jgi:myosin regulatory light chain 12
MNKKPHAREASGAAYTMFTPDQVKQFKEAFNMIDQDGDGRVTEDDLRVMLSNLGTSSPISFLQWWRYWWKGQTPTPTLLNSLLSSRPGSETASSSSKAQGINFTQFLAMMGEHLLELDPEEDIVDAFSCFDEGDKGVVDVKEMRKFLGELGDRMEDWEVSPAEPGDSQVFGQSQALAWFWLRERKARSGCWCIDW